MIDLYTWTTPNGRKVSIMLEELGVEYSVKPVDFSNDEQFQPSFLMISPNNKIPAIVDHDTGQTLMESGAIMLYLAEKYGRFGGEGDNRWRVIEWLMWEMGGLGPIAGQTHHFLKFNPGKAPYAEERFQRETKCLYGVLEDRLKGREYIAGEYTIADMASWPWISRFEWQQIDLNEYPRLKEWYLRILDRPAVQRGYQIPKDMGPIPRP